MSAVGHRCESRTRLESDHAKPIACGGETSVANLQLRCRTHNPYAAEQAFGRGSMRGKRARRGTRPVEADAQPALESVIPWRRSLGFSVTDAKRGQEIADASGEQALELRVRAALRTLGARHVRTPLAMHAAP